LAEFLIAIPIALLGWLGGVLVNLVADILPAEEASRPPTCPNCNSKIPWLVYLVSARRCPSCAWRRGPRTWIVELATILATLWVWHNPLGGVSFILSYLPLVTLGVILVIDIEHRLIFTYTLIPAAILGLLVGIARFGLAASLLGGLIGFVFVLVLYLLGFLFTRLLVRWRGADLQGSALGFGDVLLSAALGLMVAWPEILDALVIAILAAGGYSLAYMLLMLARGSYRTGSAIPYAPFLILGALSALLV